MPERHKTDYQIRQIMKYNRDGSPDQQQARHQSLMRDFKHLQEHRGYSRRFDVHRFGKKEVCRLVHDMKEKGLSHRTIANRLVHLRWLASKVGREDQIPSNKDLGLRLRQNEPGHGENKAMPLLPEHLENMDPRMQLVNELKAAFGLREEEALKFQHRYATSASEKYIRLKSSWTKGGRPRVIEVVNQQQVDLLNRVKAHQIEHREKSMIPRGMKYMSYKKAVQAVSTQLGIKGHGFRHQWAQQRFEQISGLRAPIAGGPRYTDLSPDDQARWDKAARLVNSELGHGKGREDITATYIGARG